MLAGSSAPLADIMSAPRVGQGLASSLQHIKVLGAASEGPGGLLRGLKRQRPLAPRSRPELTAHPPEQESSPQCDNRFLGFHPSLHFTVHFFTINSPSCPNSEKFHLRPNLEVSRFQTITTRGFLEAVGHGCPRSSPKPTRVPSRDR
ncbi:hypothetical protein B0H10DRAFT_615056 [Mycena sp. CBHHK59/15]|nr:hypothetical protein B0H10DRAFT_615056 [Mycena sp. CBHHK59/15]